MLNRICACIEIHSLFLRPQNSINIFMEQINTNKSLSLRQTNRHEKSKRDGRKMFYWEAKNHTLYVCFLIAISVFSSCQLHHKYDYATAEDALDAYSVFMQNVKSKSDANMDELISIVKEWRVISDSVNNCILQHSVSSYNFHNPNRYQMIDDSIREHMLQLVKSHKHSFTDYLKALKELNEVEVDAASQKTVDFIQGLYQTIDTVQTYGKHREETIRLYEDMLDVTLKKGIQTRQDAVVFLQKEDIAFRSFLTHLSSLGNSSLGNIRIKTEEVIQLMAGNPLQTTPVFDKNEIVILLHVRSNRRLLQNAEACLNDLKHIRPISSNQATAYLWMLIQPWLSFDGISYALMNEKQIRFMETLAKEMPGMAATLKCSGFPLDVDELPVLLIQTLILDESF